MFGKIWLSNGYHSDDGYATVYTKVRFAEPGDIGAAILFLASDDARVINGAVLLADMGTLA